jgi:hypothetical protein
MGIPYGEYLIKNLDAKNSRIVHYPKIAPECGNLTFINNL